MKRIILFSVIFIALSGAATSIFLFSKKSGKIGTVSESISIPYFIGDYMNKAKSDIQSMTLDTSVNGRLANLGFTQKANIAFSPYAAGAINTLMQVYDSIYPTKQFVNFGCISELLNKYKLSIGASDSYIGEMPRFAIDLMEKFKPSFIYSRVGSDINEFIDGIDKTALIGHGFGNMEDYFSQTYARITHGRGTLGKETNLVKYSLLDLEKRSNSVQFLVIAPSSYFSGNKSEGGVYGTNIKDPIILAPVIGGYIIVATW